MRANAEKQPGRWSARAALGGAAVLALGLLLAGCGEGQTARPPQGDAKKMMRPQERASYEAYQKRGQRNGAGGGGAMGRPGMPGMGAPGMGGPPTGVTPR